MEGAGDQDMERVLSESRTAVSRIIQRVEEGCSDLQEAAFLLSELTSTSDRLAGLVEKLLGGLTVLGDPSPGLMLVPAVIEDAPLPGNLQTTLIRVDTGRALLRSSRAELHRLRRDLSLGVREIPVEAALDSLRTVPTTAPRRWWRHPLALAWGIHLGHCLTELASAGESLAVSIELSARADARDRMNAVSGTTTTAELAVAASTSSECVAALRAGMTELRVLSHVLARGVGYIGLVQFQTALASVPIMADSDEDD